MLCRLVFSFILAVNYFNCFCCCFLLDCGFLKFENAFASLFVYFHNCRELKDNLGSDDPEGDIPVLLQAILARNPNVFREKSMQNRYGVQSGKHF